MSAPATNGFDCTLRNVAEPTPYVVGSGPWPIHSRGVASSLASCGHEVSVPGDARRVERVVDGDTLVIEGGEKVRLIGVDTPEALHPNRPVEPGGPEATAFTRAAVSGKTVHLVYDSRMGRKDRFGRTLAYVVEGDGSVLNERLIEAGLGFADPRFPFCWAEKYRKAQGSAKAARTELWTSKAVAARTRGDEHVGGWAGPGRSGSGSFGGSARATGSASGGGGTVHVKGYTRSDGTYVQPHTRSAPSL